MEGKCHQIELLILSSLCVLGLVTYLISSMISKAIVLRILGRPKLAGTFFLYFHQWVFPSCLCMNYVSLTRRTYVKCNVCIYCCYSTYPSHTDNMYENSHTRTHSLCTESHYVQVACLEQRILQSCTVISSLQC